MAFSANKTCVARLETSLVMSGSLSSSHFPTTCWGRVARAYDPSSTAAKEALAELCAAYWYPLYALIRRWGHSADEAQDLTQAYFVHLLERKVFAAADPHRAKLRTFLRADCHNFLADQRDREGAQKRGGDRSFVSIDVRDAEGRYLVEPSHALTSERLFDHAWALTLLGHVLDRLSAEYNGSQRGPLFDQLRVVLTEGPGSIPYATIAARLSMSEAAVQKAASRIRRRYGKLLSAQIALTLHDPTESAIDEEIRDLFDALAL
jgi:RNA polymerase sigma-70 factor (ECF subfamily)